MPARNALAHVLLATKRTYEHDVTGAWSKTMIGYGPEEEGFALELTYNYGIDSYKNGDDLQHICLQRDVEATKAKAQAEGERERERERGQRSQRGRGGGRDGGRGDLL